MNGISMALKLGNIKTGEIAKFLGVKQPQVNSWLNGDRPIPKKHLLKLSKLLEVDEEFLLNRLDEQAVIYFYKKSLEKEIGKSVEISVK